MKSVLPTVRESITSDILRQKVLWTGKYVLIFSFAMIGSYGSSRSLGTLFITVFLLFISGHANPFHPTPVTLPFQTLMASQNTTLYFGYGSNLWLNQMAMRCPSSRYLGIARLPKHRWQIYSRGYANVVSSSADYVYGLVYALTPENEEHLDGNEGVPFAYNKETLHAEVWYAGTKGVKAPIDVEAREADEVRGVLVYVNRNDTKEAKPKTEYIYRMNRGIDDAIKVGVPETYIEKYLRKYIPKEEENSAMQSQRTLARALKQAADFRDERQD